MLTSEEIAYTQKQALAIGTKYFKCKGYTSLDECKTDVDDIFQNIIYPEYEFDLKFAALGYSNDNKKILGLTNPKRREILLDIDLRNDSKYAFTLAHEIAHVVTNCTSMKVSYCTEETFLEIGQLPDTERKANIFAAYLLMPPAVVEYRVRNLPGNPHHYPRYIGPQEYSIHDRKLFIRNIREFCWHLAYPLTPFFSKVSADSLGIQISNLELIVNATQEQSHAFGFNFSPITKQNKAQDLGRFTHIGNISFLK